MTIRFLKQWNGHHDQEVASLDVKEEARLVGLGLATYQVIAIKSGPVFDSISDLPPASGFVGVVQVGNSILVSDKVSYSDIAAKNPRIVENIILGPERFDAGNVLGTGVVTDLSVPTAAGVRNRILKCDSGSAGRVYANIASTPVTAGNWYVVSCYIEDFTLTAGTHAIMKAYGTGTMDRGITSITANNVIAGGVGRYAFACRCSVTGNLDLRFGIGIDANVANQSVTVTKWQVENLGTNPKDGFGPSEYVYPLYEAAFNSLKNSGIDENNKVVEPSHISYYPTKRYSNILAIGDSRMDEISDIGGQLKTLVKADNSGSVSWCGFGGLRALDIINGYTHQSITLDLTTYSNFTALTRDFSSTGAEEIYDYLYPTAMPFDTLLIADFGFNSVQLKSQEAKTPAVAAKETMDEITVIVDAFVANNNNMSIIMTDNNPCGGYGSLHANTIAALKLLNAKIEVFCKQRGYLYVSIYQALSDATTEDNMAAAYTSDGLHPNTTGTTLIAQAVKDARDRYR